MKAELNMKSSKVKTPNTAHKPFRTDPRRPEQELCKAGAQVPGAHRHYTKAAATQKAQVMRQARGPQCLVFLPGKTVHCPPNTPSQ